MKALNPPPINAFYFSHIIEYSSYSSLLSPFFTWPVFFYYIFFFNNAVGQGLCQCCMAPYKTLTPSHSIHIVCKAHLLQCQGSHLTDTAEEGQIGKISQQPLISMEWFTITWLLFHHLFSLLHFPQTALRVRQHQAQALQQRIKFNVHATLDPQHMRGLLNVASNQNHKNVYLFHNIKAEGHLFYNTPSAPLLIWHCKTHELPETNGVEEAHVTLKNSIVPNLAMQPNNPLICPIWPHVHTQRMESSSSR